MRRSRGFTLTELMITVSLIGVLAAIAIPEFVRYQARARRSEGFTHVAGIARAYKAYHAEQGRYPDTQADGGFPSLPDTASLGTQKLPWDNDTENFFKIVGWRPDGAVYYTYEVESDGCGGGCTDRTCFTITAHGNVDGNASYGAIMYVQPLRDGSGVPIVGASCSNILAYGTPTAPVSGDPVYEEPAVYLLADPY
jgi:type IV pilus assembly protein PilA